jgi:NTE family protein
LHPDWGLLSRLRQDGRETAKQWLAQNVEQVGCGSTIDLAEMFL